ncbi:Choline transporter-like protein 3 [Linum perenne]
MGSNTDEPDTKRVASSSSSSSPTHPLLFKPPLDEPTTSDPSPDYDPTQFLQISYNSGPRQFKDITFLILFLLFLISTFGLGIFSIVHKNPNYGNLSSFTFDSKSASCVPASPNSASSSPAVNFYYFLLNLGESRGFVDGLIWVIVATVILSGPISFLLLFSLRHYTKYLVYASLPFFIIMPVFFNVYWFVACTVSSSCRDTLPLGYRIFVMALIFLVIGVLVWILVANWHRVELTIDVIGVASDALYKNLGLFVALPLLTFGLVVYYVPIVVFLVFARFNGKIVPKELHGEFHCGWKEASWVPAYFTLAIVTLLWSSATMVETQVYVISGTIGQWYFSKGDSPPKRGIRTSLRNAFGPSSGSICLSGLLIFIVRMVRAAVDSAKREDSPGIVNLILRTCVNAFLSAIEFLNKFTINFVAITGESYCTSARMAYELLKRNLLSAVFVEVISTRILGGITFVISAVYAIVVCAILKGATNLGADSYYVAILAWVVLIVVLGFFVHVLDNVIDTIYMCYAIDRDRGEVYKSDVHEVYVHLPISRNNRPSLGPRTSAVV